ncbi:MAG: hypothetical protein DRQ48_01030 [Gammaproteobacteria bacterium]|nr:MAG: hypothetical protein DRQ44_00340 [Gammaproteobacteria bacterium]RKZ72263.1 MAG: hypothetical protein DRQ48_01030 [Gammaproteobacteria bacterium]
MDSWTFEFTDMLAIICVHVGSYLKIKKMSVGWLFSLAAISYFIGRTIDIGLLSQCIGHAVSFCLASYGFLKWRKEEKAGKST